MRPWIRFGVLAINVCTGVLGGCGSPYLLTVGDRICAAGEKIRLVGKLEYRGIAVLNKGLDDRKLLFYLDSRYLGRDETNDEGYASVKHRFRRPGVHRLDVRYHNADNERTAGSANIFVWAEDGPILIVDIDDTVCETKKRYLFSGRPDISPAFPHASEVLRELSERFRIVYLTARPREIVDKTRDWLMRNRFPLGPVLTWDADKDSWSSDDYKKESIDRLQDEFDRIGIGIGNTKNDYKAYRKRKLFSIILDSDEGPAFLDGGVRVPDWRAVRELFSRNPHLFERGVSRETDVDLPTGGR